MATASSLFERFIARPRYLWLAPLAVALVLLTQVFGGLASGELSAASGGPWRGLLAPPIVMIYILLVAPWLDRMGVAVLTSLRVLTTLSESDYRRLVDRLGTIRARDEALAILLGMAMGAALAISNLNRPVTWLGVTWVLMNMSQYGLLIWTIFTTIATTRLARALLQQPLRLDPLDASPLEAFGRQSLILSLVFAGGITLGLLITFTDAALLLDLRFWITYIPLGLIPVAVFFLNMQPTHRVLLAARKEELERVQRRIRATCHGLMRALDEHRDDEPLSRRLHALSHYEQRLLAARTWPYNTTMLRTLFFSVLVPAGTLAGKLLGDRLFE